MPNLSNVSRSELEYTWALIREAERRKLNLLQSQRFTSSEQQPRWASQPGPQTAFYNCWADICIFGGSAGAGKTGALLIEPTKYITVPNFSCVTFRRTSPQVTNPGGLWDESEHVYPQCGGVPVKGLLEWRFPSGAKVVYRHLEHDITRTDWSGAQIALLQFDELFTFSDKQFWFLSSRNRSTCGVRPYIRATTNPDPDSWLATLLAWWIDQDTGFPILDRSGVIRWLVRSGEDLIWFAQEEYLAAKAYIVQLTKDDRAEPKSVTFIPGRIDDNTKLLETNPEYLSSLHALPYVEKMQLLYGNWKVRPAAGKVFNRAWFEIVGAAPAGRVTQVRFWDLAASSDKAALGDWTAGVRMSVVEAGLFYIEDVVHGQWSPLERDRVILQTAQLDGPDVHIWIEQEPGSAGKSLTDALIRLLVGFTVHAERPTGDKITRAQPFAAQGQAGNVKIVAGQWNRMFLDELHAFPEGAHDDQVDGASGAFNKIAGKNFAPRVRRL